MTIEMLDKLVAWGGVMMCVILGIIVCGIISDYILPRLPGLVRLLERIGGYEDDEETYYRYRNARKDRR